jgi:hypothetical protein
MEARRPAAAGVETEESLCHDFLIRRELATVSKNGNYKMGLRASQKPQHTPPKNSENGRTDTVRLLHGFIWPLLGQKSSHKNCFRSEILATSARVIWPCSVASPDGFTIPWLPSCTADDFLHHEQTAGK